MITSTANHYVKLIRSLCVNRRERRRERSFVLEGVRLVAEALMSGAVLRVVLFVPDQLHGVLAGQQLLNQLIGQPYAYETTKRVMSAITETVTAQGVVAVAAWPELKRRNGVVLLLDAIQDPGNVGTLLRSAEASGVGLVCCSRGTVDIYSPKVARAAMGAHFSLPLQTDQSWEELDEFIADCPHVYAAVAQACLPYYAADWRQSAVLILGNEAQGIGSEGLARATRRIAIPMVGRAESLNVGVAGSIILFEALRQRSHSH